MESKLCFWHVCNHMDEAACELQVQARDLCVLIVQELVAVEGCMQVVEGRQVEGWSTVLNHVHRCLCIVEVVRRQVVKKVGCIDTDEVFEAVSCVLEYVVVYVVRSTNDEQVARSDPAVRYSEHWQRGLAVEDVVFDL